MMVRQVFRIPVLLPSCTVRKNRWGYGMKLLYIIFVKYGPSRTVLPTVTVALSVLAAKHTDLRVDPAALQTCLPHKGVR